MEFYRSQLALVHKFLAKLRNNLNNSNIFNVKMLIFYGIPQIFIQIVCDSPKL